MHKHRLKLTNKIFQNFSGTPRLFNSCTAAAARLNGPFVPAGQPAAERGHWEFENSHPEVRQETAQVGEESTPTKGRQTGTVFISPYLPTLNSALHVLFELPCANTRFTYLKFALRVLFIFRRWVCESRFWYFWSLTLNILVTLIFFWYRALFIYFFLYYCQLFFKKTRSVKNF